ncbi:PIN domain-containing protein [Bordetella sp. N]|uniref:PIN domain-containing protein n=1 Tax=Bordetella sp. N TaxID=1746199 RepID=UPI000709C7A9|nr:PIN domain-containing protein [Bordetella sp. N]ALM87088.1 pilus assembly protein [Bordetella sp. N]
MIEADKPAFIDSNVLLYLFADEPSKVGVVRTLLKGRPTISVQVLNEVTNVCRRKLGRSWEEIDEIIDVIQQLCSVSPLTLEIHNFARQIASRYEISFYDACIVAAAASTDCSVLYTEDMHYGLKVGARLTIVNPFK